MTRMVFVHTDIISTSTTPRTMTVSNDYLDAYKSPSDDGKDKTTVTTDKDGVVHTDILSRTITTTDY
ncbi:hypothetical protein J7294_03213 [Nakaseomyces glabratus]|nr:hypothetical protein J7294_03213 [Nakaseomyces glabratus]